MNSTTTGTDKEIKINSKELPSQDLLIKDADLEGISLSLEGTLPKIREFFKIRDDLQASNSH